jgi:hypothetical protein
MTGVWGGTPLQTSELPQGQPKLTNLAAQAFPLYNCRPAFQLSGSWLAGNWTRREKMKRLLIAVVAMACIVVLAEIGLAQGNPRGTAEIIFVGGKGVSVEYGRPSLKGRAVSDLLSQLKTGDFWRLGADKSTTFSTAVDLQFGGVTVPKGEYSLWAQRGADNSWKLVFNKQHGQWGMQHNTSLDLVSVPLKESKASSSAEMVTISLTKQGAGAVIAIQWGEMQLTADFKVK